jgi:hypothetical protein
MPDPRLSYSEVVCVDSRPEKGALRPHGEVSNSTSRPSLRTAIDKKCRECIYDPKGGGGTWREQVTACTSYRCPLYPVRPMAKGAA